MLSGNVVCLEGTEKECETVKQQAVTCFDYGGLIAVY